MVFTVEYTLPDELDLFIAALKAKSDHYKPICPIERSALEELHGSIKLYMLQPSSQNLSQLNKIIQKYESYK